MDESAYRHRADARARPPSLTGTPGLLGELLSLPPAEPSAPVSRPRSVYSVTPPFLRPAGLPAALHKPAPYKPPILPAAVHAPVSLPEDAAAAPPSVFSASAPFWMPPHRDHPQQPMLAPQRQHQQEQKQEQTQGQEQEHEQPRPRALTDNSQPLSAGFAGATRRGSLPSRVAPTRRRGSSAARPRTPPVALASPRAALSPGTASCSRRSTCEDVWCDAERDLLSGSFDQNQNQQQQQQQQNQQQQKRHERQRSVSLLPAPPHGTAAAVPLARTGTGADASGQAGGSGESLAALLSALPPPAGAARPVVLPPGFCDGPADLRAAVLNPAAFDVGAARGARFFVIKAPGERDVLASVRHGAWASSDAGTRRLAAALRDAHALGQPVYLFFSVNGSGQFCGAAQLVRVLEACSSDAPAVPPAGPADERRRAVFGVRWLFVKNVPNSYLRHIRMPNCDNRPVTNCRDAQELLAPQGLEVLAVFYSFCHSTSLLDAVLGAPTVAAPASAAPVVPRPAHSKSASSRDVRCAVLPLRAPLSVPSSPAPPALSPFDYSSPSFLR